jgi:osmotically-inducible protein OsmY
MRTIPTLFGILACASALVGSGCSRSDTAAETAGTAELTSFAARPSDDELIRRVEGAISARPELAISARNAEVDALDGVILLRGSVPDNFVKNDVEKLASTVPGVVTTLNKIDVRGASEAEVDDTIAFSIQRAFVTDPTIANEADHVTIDVNHGIVTLRGRATSADGSLAVERVVDRTPGVVTVMNRLRSD